MRAEAVQRRRNGSPCVTARRDHRRQPPARVPEPAAAVGADLRPDRVADLGTRDRPPRPQHGPRPVVEAAAGDRDDDHRAAGRGVGLHLGRGRARGSDRGHPPLGRARRAPCESHRRRCRRRGAGRHAVVAAQRRDRQFRGHHGRAGARRRALPPAGPQGLGVRAGDRRGPAAPGGLAVPRALRAVAGVGGSVASEVDRRWPGSAAAAVVRAGVLGFGQRFPRFGARAAPAREQPRLRRSPGARGHQGRGRPGSRGRGDLRGRGVRAGRRGRRAPRRGRRRPAPGPPQRDRRARPRRDSRRRGSGWWP